MDTITPIAHIQNNFTSKFGVPRQSNVVQEVVSRIVFESEYRTSEATRGLEDFSYIWLIWGFSKAERKTWTATVRPPKLGGNTRMGVFATRSPFRPNSLGLSSVKLDKIEIHPTLGSILHVKGADLIDGTPIYDIKPYLPFTDSHPDAAAGFTDNNPHTIALQVVFAPAVTQQLSNELLEQLRPLLAQDPRPSYHHDPKRIYGMPFGDMDIKFTVEHNTLTVHEITSLQ